MLRLLRFLPAYLLLLMLPYPAQAQDFSPDNLIYDDLVKTVQFYRGTAFTTPSLKAAYPVLFLNDNTPLSLEFDELIDLDTRESDFFVEIVNCDADWNQSTLLPIEFYDGFTRDRIDLFQRAEFTQTPYMHYAYSFPQEHERFKMSGNYVLKVFRNNNERELVLSRRFIVVERRFQIQSKFELSARVERINMDKWAFDVRTGGVRIFNPALDLNVRVLQNFRWDNAVKLTQPRFFGNNSFEYLIDFNRSYSGGNEFRRHDARSTQMISESVQTIDDPGDTPPFLVMRKDKIRTYNTFGAQQDRNGVFSVESFEWPHAETQADYVLSRFRLYAPSPYDAEVYVFGAFSDWKLKEEYRMEYQEGTRQYEADILLKQGLYDYQYVLKTKDGTPNESKLEGSHSQTENFYNILIYYRNPGDRTDQLWGFEAINYY